MEIVFITSNKAKVAWANNILKDYDIRFVQMDLNLKEEGRSLDVEDIVKDKAKQSMEKTDKPFIINDIGFYIEALNGFPATQMRFCLSTIGIAGALELMKNQKNRRAYFKSALVFVENGKIKVFTGIYDGTVSENQRGENIRGWSDFLKIFIPNGHTKTPAEMSDSEWDGYQRWFSRTDPYMQFFEWIKKR